MNIRRGRILGWVLVCGGALFLLDSLFTGFNFWHFLGNLWPILLIALGIFIISHRGRFDAPKNSSDKIVEFIGEKYLDFEGEELGDREISIFAGELTVDLTSSELASGENELRVSMGIGETLVKVPDGFPVRIWSRLFAGELGYDEEMNAGVFPEIDRKDSDYDSSDKKLSIRMEGFAGEMKVRIEQRESAN